MGDRIRVKKVYIAAVGVQIVIYYKIRKIDTVTNKKNTLKNNDIYRYGMCIVHIILITIDFFKHTIF